MTTSNDLLQYVERIGRLLDEKEGISQDVREIYAEAKDKGYSPKALRHALKIFRLPAEDRPAAISMLETLDTYLNALGILADTELGQHALARKQWMPSDIGPTVSASTT